MTSPVIRIATRSSKLALWQAEYVRSLLRAAVPDVAVEIVHVKTVGDKNQTDALRQFGGTGVFTREVQNSVLSGDTEIAVHSLKDLPTESAEGLVLGGVPERAPTADALLLPNAEGLESLSDLPPGARIGTGSPRRQAQLLHLRPDLKMLEIRGNVETRIRKLDDGDYDAIVLAEAGLQRLGLTDRISLLLAPPDVLPAVGQGAIGIECRENDASTLKALTAITDVHVLDCVRAERALLKELRAGCHAPLGAWTELSADQLKLTAVLLSSDGTQRLSAEATGPQKDPEKLGVDVAGQLLKSGGQQLVDAI